MLHNNLLNFRRAAYAIVNMQVIETIGQARHIESNRTATGYLLP